MSDFNIANYIGMPYCLRNENGVNCWGLVAKVYADLANERLPDFPALNSDSRVIAAVFSSAFASGAHGFHVVDSPRDFDVIVFHRETKFGRVYHCGVMYNNCVLHSVRGLGVIYKTVEQSARGFRGFEFWRK